MKPAQRKLSTFRLHLALTTAIVAGSFALVIAAAMFVPLVSQLNRTDLDLASLAGIAEYILYLHSTYWPVILSMLVASVASGLFLFRRMKAPLVRFVRIFEAVGRGGVPKALRIRKIDYLGEEVAALNRMLERLAERADAQERSFVRLESALAELEASGLQPVQVTALVEARDAARALQGPTSVEA